jgi:hypothetical protein
MSATALEERVAALEKKVKALEIAIADGGLTKDWRSTVGMFSGDEGMKRIDEAGRKWRETERRKARKTTSKTNAKKR